MAKVQRVRFADDSVSHTVVDASGLPVAPAREYLRFLADSGASPNTVRTYATGLAMWWSVLEHTGHGWDDFPTGLFGQYLAFVRHGDLPGASRIGELPASAPSSTVQTRAAAVLSLYRYHADAHNLDTPYDRLFTARRQWKRSRYKGFREGIGPRREVDRPIYQVRHHNQRQTPVLLPVQVATILDACAQPSDLGPWSGPVTGLRNRLLFALLAETGMRLGEALSLRHSDFHISGGGTPYLDVAARQDHPRGARSKTGARRIYIGDDLVALYSEFVWQLIEMAADVAVPDLAQHFVFVNLLRGRQFAPMRPETVYATVRAISAARRQQLPPGWSPHWLRHTHATALLLAGVGAHVVMRRLGHADVQTTLSLYGWVTEDAEMRALAEWKNYAASWKGLVP